METEGQEESRERTQLLAYQKCSINVLALEEGRELRNTGRGQRGTGEEESEERGM